MKKYNFDDRITFETRMTERKIETCNANIESARKNLTNTVTNGTILDIATFAKPYIEQIEKNLAELNSLTTMKDMLEGIASEYDEERGQNGNAQ